MNPHKNLNYTERQIEKLLVTVKECVKKDRFSIPKHRKREENREFIIEYNLRTNKIKEILLSIDTKDFCYSVKNKKKGYEHEDLYIFAPQVQLFTISDEEEFVNMYIKLNILRDSEGEFIVFISFHKRNKPISYLFR